MPDVSRLTFVDLTAPDVERASHYYEQVLGMTSVEKLNGAHYLSVGLDHHNLCIRTAAGPGLGAIGFQLPPATSMKELAKHFTTIGLRPELKSDGRPGIASLIQVLVGGHTFELFTEMLMPAPGFSRRGVQPLKLGHLALLSSDADRMVAFLRDELSFHVTDQLENLATFLTCNTDHHVLNVVAAPISTMHHLAFQLEDREHHFRAADVLATNGVPTLWGPARHTAGHNVAAYHRGADDALIELYSDMDVFVPALGLCEPRPWHTDIPQRPKRWPLNSLTRWETRFDFDLTTVAFGSKATVSGEPATD